MRNIFRVHIERLVRWLIPEDMAGAKNKSFIRAAVSYLKELYRDFKNHQNRLRYELEHGEHIAHLEAVLNDAFDMGFRRIKVVDAPDQYEPVYIYQDAEQKPVYIYTQSENQPKPLFTDHEIEFEGIDFVVQIHYTIPYDVNQIKALIEKYKTPGMAYIIEETF